MGLIKDMAIEFVDIQYDGCENPQQFVDTLKSELRRHREQKDKIRYVQTVIGEIELKHDEHFKVCPNKENCGELKEYKQAIYFLNGILADYGINTDSEDIFSENEKLEYSAKLEKILEDLAEVKKGQELIYNDLHDEIEELKNFFFLGKKNWKQLVAGKTIDMVAGGVISETISKELIKLTGIVTNTLLNNS